MHSYNRAHFLQLRWAIYIILILAYMSVFFHRMAPGVVSADLMLAFNTTGAALMQPLFDWVLDQTWDGTLVNGLRQFAIDDYRAALWLMLGFAVIALIGTFRLTETYCRNVTVKD